MLRHWSRLLGLVIAVMVTATQILGAMSWGVEWWSACIFAVAIFVQGYFVGRSLTYKRGLDEGAAMATKVWRDGIERMQAQAAEEAIEMTPHELGEKYTAMVSHRDRSS